VTPGGHEPLAACARCGPLGEQHESSSTSPSSGPEQWKLVSCGRTADLCRCPDCGAHFHRRSWSPGGSEDFQVTWYYDELTRLAPLAGFERCLALLEEHHLDRQQASTLAWAAATPEAGRAFASTIVAAAAERLLEEAGPIAPSAGVGTPPPGDRSPSTATQQQRRRAALVALARFSAWAEATVELHALLAALQQRGDDLVSPAAARALELLGEATSPLPLGFDLPAPRPGHDLPWVPAGPTGQPPGLSRLDLPHSDGVEARYQVAALAPDGHSLVWADDTGLRTRLGLPQGAPLCSSAGAPAAQPWAACVGPSTVAVATCRPAAIELWSEGPHHTVALSDLEEASYVPHAAWHGSSARFGALFAARWPHADYVVVDATTRTIAWRTGLAKLGHARPSPDGRRVLLGGKLAPSDKYRLEVRDATTGAALQYIGLPGLDALAWSRDGSALLLALGAVRLCYDLASQAVRWEQQGPKTWQQQRLLVSPDGASCVETAGTRGLLVRDVATGAVRVDVPFADDVELTELAWSHDSTRLVTLGRQGSVRVWNAQSGLLVAQSAPDPALGSGHLSTSRTDAVLIRPSGQRSVLLWRLDALGHTGAG
jgi:hypothetical protein